MPEPIKAAPSKLRRIIGATFLVVLIVILLLMFRKPAPIAQAMLPADVASNAESFQQKLSSLAPQPPADPDSPSTQTAADEVRLTTDEVQAALVQANDPAYLAKEGSAASPPSVQTPSGEQITLQSVAPVISFEKDVVKGQFQAELAGQKVIVTVAGHLGAKDGYATFDPTEFKIGDVPVPVSMVNSALQKKIIEQRDRMQLPDFIADIAIQDGQLVIKRK